MPGGDLNLRIPRGILTAGEAVWRDYRVVLVNGTLRVFSSDGELHLTADVVSTQAAGSRTWELTMDTGEVWSLEKMGCGCGGG
jgi:hypothetical protein